LTSPADPGFRGSRADGVAFGPMLRSHVVALAAAALVLAGCGTSDKHHVAQVLNSYADSLAAGDGQAACRAFSPQGRRYETPRPDTCTRLETYAARLTPAQRRGYHDAVAVVQELEGDRAIAFLRFGNCTAIATGTELTRDASGHWQIFHVGLTTNGFGPRCREQLPDDIRHGSLLRSGPWPRDDE
jgi:hypothetical protein